MKINLEDTLTIIYVVAFIALNAYALIGALTNG